jgi:hypothetical protein
MGGENTSHGDFENNCGHPSISPAGAPRVYRVEHRIEGASGVVLAIIENVFAHHDTLTQYVSRLLNEQGDEPLSGELVLVDNATDQVLARRDLSRACADAKRGRQRHRHGL